MGLKSIEPSHNAIGWKLGFVIVVAIIAATAPYFMQKTLHPQRPISPPVVVGTTARENSTEPVDPLGTLIRIDGIPATPTPSPHSFAEVVKDTATDALSDVLGISTGVLEDAASKSAETMTDFALRQAVQQVRERLNQFTPRQQKIIQEGICAPQITPTVAITPTPAENEVLVTVTPAM